MNRTSMLAALALALSLVGAPGVGAAPAEFVSTSPTPFVAPEGIEQGLWALLPEEDRRAILGEPYPIMFAATPQLSDDGGSGPADPVDDGYACWPPSSVLRAC